MIKEIQEFVLYESFHIVMFFSLIVAFYFIYASKEQKLAVQNTIGESIKKLIKLLPQGIRENVKNSIINKMRSKYTEDINKVNASRNKYLMYTLIGIGVAIILFVILNIVLYKKSPKTFPNAGKIIMYNVVSILLLGIIEFVFFKTVILKMEATTLNIAVYDYLKDLKTTDIGAQEKTNINIKDLLSFVTPN